MVDFERDNQRRVGERGNPIFERTEETTDLDEMREKEVETTGTCYCGRPVNADSVRRCVSCESIVCSTCQVVVRREIVCQTCAEQAYSLDKEVFLTLHFLDADMVAAEQLVKVVTDGDGEPVEVQIDAVAHPIVVNRYIAEDGSLTPRGREALQVGQQLYGEDGDVRKAIQTARIEEVADQ